MIFQSNICPVCKKNRNIKGIHISCSKIMKQKVTEEKEKLAKAVRRRAQYKYSKSNKEKINIHAQNRRARKKSNGGKLSKELPEKLYKLQNGKCVYCKSDLNKVYHLDHIIPLAKGGLNSDENIQLLCPFCNLSKGSKDHIEFMKSKNYIP